MKINYSVFKQTLIILCFLFSGKGVFSQTVNVPYQFYLDANNNCTYDGGEKLLYNLPGYLSLSYVNTSAATVNTSTYASCSIGTLSVFNPSVPAVNVASFSLASSNSYPTFSINTSCSAYTNLSYTATNYLPVKNINQMENVGFSSWGTGNYSGYLTGNAFPVCFNLGTDSISLYFGVDNLFTCNSTMASRTYSLYLDGVLLDQVTTTGVNTFNYISGAKSTISEQYMDENTGIYLRTQLNSNISSLGLHTFSIISTNLYNSSLSALNYSCTLNSILCNKISGEFFNDCNSNCIKDAGDGNIFAGVQGKVYQSVGGYSVSFSPNGLGRYSCYLPFSSNPYLITTYTTVPTVTACANSTVSISSSVTTSSVDFGFKPQISNSDDPFTYLWQKPGVTSTPSGTIELSVYIYDYPLATCSGTNATNPGKLKVKLDKNFTYQNIVIPTPIPTSIISDPSGDTLVWNISDFYFMQSSYYIIAAISPTLSVGSTYSVSAVILPLYDNVLANNNSSFTWTIGVPMDPNNKLCYAQGIQPNGDIPFGVQDLYYTVNFQNIGTAPAINVTTLDTLDANLDWTTLQVLGSSFPVQTQIDNLSGQTIFSFKNINLPDSNANEPGSHGFVRYSIKLKTGVPVNTIIKNRAHNYFDFQPPVATNQTKNKLVILSGIDELEKEKAVFIAPNPVADKLIISAKEIIQTISVFNNLGQIVLKQDVNALQSQMDLTTMTDGIYFINIQFKDGSKTVRKVIKN